MADKKKKPAGTPDAHVEVTPGTAFDLDALKQIVELLEASEVTSLDWRRNGERLSIRRGPPPAPVMQPVTMPLSPAVHVVPPAPAPAAPGSAPLTPRPSAPRPTVAAEAKEDKKGHVITSPFVGTFYRSPAPDQPSYVEVGAAVKKGQVLCIVEAMKLMNEIESEVAGKVAEVLAQNGQPVEFGQPLFRIE
ncbi:MAG: acetyl-CoA carboxylase biotin carboxyl carrier protein [Myxococcaceae bacterium]|nr:acetyl-CoA carboxylase biotin carboxyl carrier protein [Myxococcaceae bacterium]